MITQNVLKTETRYCTTYHQTHTGANFTTSFCHIQVFERMQSHLLPTNSLQTLINNVHAHRSASSGLFTLTAKTKMKAILPSGEGFLQQVSIL